MKNSMEGPEKTKNRPTILPSNLTPGHIPRENHSSKRCMHRIFIAALFTIAMTWKQPKYPSTQEWINKMCYIYTMQYNSAIERNEMMSSAEKWMDLETVIQSKASQKEKNII